MAIKFCKRKESQKRGGPVSMLAKAKKKIILIIIILLYMVATRTELEDIPVHLEL